MKNKLLMPAQYKKIRWVVFVTTTIAFAGFVKFEWEPSILNFTYGNSITGGTAKTNLLKEIIFTSWMIGLIMIAFSKEKREDEFIAYLRLSSWQYSVIASLLISIIGTWSIYGLNYLTFAGLNMLTAPLAFIVIFNISIKRTLKVNNIEK